MTNLDLTKPVQTRDGRPVRILCTDRQGTLPVVGLIREYDLEVFRYWASNGLVFGDKRKHPSDLINVPPKPMKYYVNVYRGSDGVIMGTPHTHTHKNVIGVIDANFIKTIEFEVP